MRRSAQRPRRGVVIAGAAGVLALAAAIGLACLEAEAGTDSSPAPPVPSSSPSESVGGTEDGAVTPPPDAAAARPAEGAGAADLPESAEDPSAEQWAPLVGALIDRWLDCAEGEPQVTLGHDAGPERLEFEDVAERRSPNEAAVELESSELRGDGRDRRLEARRGHAEVGHDSVELVAVLGDVACQRGHHLAKCGIAVVAQPFGGADAGGRPGAVIAQVDRQQFSSRHHHTRS